MKVFCAAFMCLQFGFVIFCRKDFGAKAAHEMLVKLTSVKEKKFYKFQTWKSETFQVESQ